MAQCKSGASRQCVGEIQHDFFGGLCSNCADARDAGKRKKNELTNEDWREGLKDIAPNNDNDTDFGTI